MSESNGLRLQSLIYLLDLRQLIWDTLSLSACKMRLISFWSRLRASCCTEWICGRTGSWGKRGSCWRRVQARSPSLPSGCTVRGSLSRLGRRSWNRVALCTRRGRSQWSRGCRLGGSGSAAASWSWWSEPASHRDHHWEQPLEVFHSSTQRCIGSTTPNRSSSSPN